MTCFTQSVRKQVSRDLKVWRVKHLFPRFLPDSRFDRDLIVYQDLNGGLKQRLSSSSEPLIHLVTFLMPNYTRKSSCHFDKLESLERLLSVTFQTSFGVTLIFLVTKKIFRTKVINYMLNINMLLGRWVQDFSVLDLKMLATGPVLLLLIVTISNL